MFQSDCDENDIALDWVLLFSSFVVVTALIGCVCGCRKEPDKDDWLGKEGKVQQLNTVDGEDHSSRSSAVNRISTAKRSLPDIPNNDAHENDATWEQPPVTASDNCSELYATVGDGPNSESATNTFKGSKKRLAPSAPSTENSQSEATPPNSKLSHEYAKLSHPYARVKPIPPKNNDMTHHASSSTVTQPSIELESSETTPGVQGGSETTLSSSIDQPVPPPRARRSSSQSSYVAQNSSSCPSVHRLSNTHRSSSSSSSSSHVADTIAAAPAILGQISASQELPYITLPLPDNNTRHNSMPADLPALSVGGDTVRVPLSTQPEEVGGHFSGDSQDSGKGYTSISVRESLASIRAQVVQEHQSEQQHPWRGQQQQRQHKIDPHYAIVSDDSDEMYAAIEDRQGSDIYAQVLPPPPNVDILRTRVADSHSRQASSSSAASSVANVGSPKPEKRQANSPLPPPPMLPPMAAPANASSEAEVPTTGRLEDMYAKVIKKKSLPKNTEHPQEPETQTNEKLQCEDNLNSSINNSQYESLHSENLVEPNYESVPASVPDAGYARVHNTSDPGYEVVRSTTSQTSSMDPNYEEVRQQGVIIEPNYELLAEDRSNYEQLPSTSSDDPNYESVGGINEPPYELLSTASSELNNTSTSDILYAKVNKSRNK